MLTTFNEVDMSGIIYLRQKYQEAFIQKHGVKLGLISFFVRAVTDTLIQFPGVNSRIEGEEIVTPEFCDIGIAVQSDKGLVVPVLRNTERMSFAMIERQIIDFAEKARTNRIKHRRDERRDFYHYKWRCFWIYAVDPYYQSSPISYPWNA